MGEGDVKAVDAQRGGCDQACQLAEEPGCHHIDRQHRQYSEDHGGQTQHEFAVADVDPRPHHEVIERHVALVVPERFQKFAEGMVAKRSLAASSISRLAAPSECRRNAALITSMAPKTSVVRAGERLRVSLRVCFTRYLTDLRERGLAPSELRPSEQPGRPGPEGKPGAEGEPGIGNSCR